jgi:hypothetical protein
VAALISADAFSTYESGLFILDCPLHKITSPYTMSVISIVLLLTDPVIVALKMAPAWYGSSCSRHAPLASAVVG